MRVFVTGATGFIGSAIVKELLHKGHQVLGLARSKNSAEALVTAGAEVLLGSLEDIEILKRGATSCDGVIHAGFIHDFANFEHSCKVDREAIQAMGDALKGTNKPFVTTAGTLTIQSKDEVGKETDISNSAFPRTQAEHLTTEFAKDGVRAMVIRLPPTVHGANDKGFIPTIAGISQQKQVVGIVGEGNNVWPAVNRFDAASVFVLALEKGAAGKVYHGVAEQGIPTKDIASVISKKLNLPLKSLTPEETQEHFGFFFAWAFSANNPISSEITRKELGWEPKYPTLLEDLNTCYFN